MKSVLLALAVSTALLPSGQDAVVLRHTMRPGTEDKYQITTTVKQEIESPMQQDLEMNTSMTYLLKYTGVDADGVADVQIDVKDIKLDMSAPMAPSSSQDQSFTAKLSPRYVVSEVKSGGGTPSEAQKMESMAGVMQGIGFPEQAVKPGDTWEWQMPDNPMLPGNSPKIKVSIVGEEVVEGKSYYVLAVDDQVTIATDASKAAEAVGGANMGQMNVSGTLHVVNRTLIEKETGRIFSSRTKSDGKLTIKMPELGAEIVSNVNSETTIKLVP